MKTRIFRDLILSGAQPVIRFLPEVDNIDLADSNMLGRVVSVMPEDKWSDDEIVVSFNVDMNDFLGHNKSIAIPNWFDDYGKPTQTWFESGMYPDNGIVEVYEMLVDKGKDADLVYIEIVDHQIIEDYLKVKDDFKSYIDYLEKCIIMSEKQRRRK